MDVHYHQHTLSHHEDTKGLYFYLEAVFKLLGDEVEDYGIDAGVDGCHVDAEVVEHQQETETTKEYHMISKSTNTTL